jgi:putative hydroxymethylpyrimidine transport system substrate-binding protein
MKRLAPARFVSLCARARDVLLLIALAGAAALAGCGEKQDTTTPASTQQIDLMLDFFPNADHAGIYQAIAEGDFRRAGLQVNVRVPSDPAAPLKLVAAGKVDLAISYEPELLLARDKGLAVMSVAALVQQPLTSIISLESAHIGSVADLEGKKVGTAGIPYQSAYLRTILETAGVEPSKVDQVDVGFNLVPAMVSKRVDATLGAFWNYEGVQLELEKKHPRVIRMEKAGVPTYSELVVVAKEETVRKRGAMIRAFIQALAQGHVSLRRDPSRGIDALLAANKDLERKLQTRAVRATLPTFFPASDSKPFGYQDPRAWARYGDWLLEHHLVKKPPAIGRAITNEFLPGQGV